MNASEITSLISEIGLWILLIVVAWKLFSK